MCYWRLREIFIISIFFHYLSNLYSKCFKNGFLLKLLANTDFVYTVSEAIACVAKPQRNGVKDIADSSEASKKLKNRQNSWIFSVEIRIFSSKFDKFKS